MKILFVGDLNTHTRSFQRFRALNDLGHEVTGLSFIPIGYKPGISTSTSVIRRIALKLGVPFDDTRINRRIIQHIHEQTFDLIWFEKSLTVRPGILTAIRASSPSTKLISYSEDDMYARHNRSWYYTKGLQQYDVVFTTKSYNCHVEELPALGAKKVVFVDKAFDTYTHRPLPVTDEERRQFGADVGFVGSFEQERAQKMLFLAEQGIPVRIWGNGWERWKDRHSHLMVENRPLFADEYIKAINATNINLCFLRKANRDLQTDRTMEIPACGAFMLAERTEEHLRLFHEGTEAAFFDIHQSHDLLEKVRYYLHHDKERQTIALAGRKRCLDSGYSHHDRLQWILQQI